jgi:hypothetical protein
MQQVEWLALPVWDVLKQAATEPEDADLALLWQEVEAAIATWLNQHDGAVPLLKLQQSLSMPLVHVWLGLLLNGFVLEQRGEFYQTKHVWVLR